MHQGLAGRVPGTTFRRLVTPFGRATAVGIPMSAPTNGNGLSRGFCSNGGHDLPTHLGHGAPDPMGRGKGGEEEEDGRGGRDGDRVGWGQG